MARFNVIIWIVIPAGTARIHKPGMANMEYIPVTWMSAIPADMTV
ncbi:hypothetical protein [Methylotuvimicrobium sp. KM1]